uniref:Small ribosomal subunit protein uS3m n=1 Tax=Hypsizygus marmoreus TaxID=39966 RepID=A0A4D6E516_HYPMA|nr:ribosomal protein S3 [Hypsizygus marmoreus]QBZ73686.1 ribosomal protein S3 [Hypsizygus marmoreus]QKJ80193.1 ribosomal protein S3 [Hypsizygus marmoreus]
MPVFNIRSLINNLGLFLPTHLLKPEPNVIFSYRLRYLYKLFLYVPLLKLYSFYSLSHKRKKALYPLSSSTPSLHPHPFGEGDGIKGVGERGTGKGKGGRIGKKLYFKILKRKIKIQRRILHKLINIGKNLVKELNYYIYIKKNLINKLEKNQSLEQVKFLIPLNPLSGSVLTASTRSTGSISISTIPTLIPQSQALHPLTLQSTGKGWEGRNELLVQINEKKLIINKTFNSIYKNNEIKIEQTIKSILKNNNFESKTDSIIHSIQSVAPHPYPDSSPKGWGWAGRAPVKLLYTSNPLTESKPIINQYLKAMSIYNMKSKGVFIFYSNVIGFNFNMGTTLSGTKLIKNVYNLLCASFKSMYCLISKPVFVITPDKIIIQLFYYLLIPNILKLKKMHKYGNRNKLNNKLPLSRTGWGGEKKNKIKKQYSKFRKIKIKVRIKLRKLSNITLTKVFPLKFKKLCLILSRLFKKPVELDLIRLHYPYNDSNILVNLLGIMINKIKLRIIIRRLFENAIIKNLNNFTLNSKVNIIPAFLSGINIRVAGRLLTHRVVPRQTVKTTRRGACARGKINFSDVARYTNKNKRGAFSITVSSGQNYF